VTLHLAYVCSEFTIHISDRLLTQRAHRWEPNSNKIILVVASNGILTLGYAGSAFVSGINTDEWLVRVITGQEPVYLGVGSGPGMHFLPLQLTVASVIDKVRRHIGLELNRHSNRDAYVEMLVTVLTWKRREMLLPRVPRARAFVRIWKDSGASGSVHVEQSTSTGDSWGTFTLGRIGQQLGPDRHNALLARLNQGSWTDKTVESELLRIIREVANDPAIPGVGSEYMAICISRNDPVISVRFYRDPRLGDEVPGYTPAIIVNGGAIILPQEFTGGGESGLTTGELDIRFQVIPPMPHSGLMQTRGQPRRSPPS
jgi:hypothetical protein